MRRVRENILVTSGDQGLFPANKEVYSCPPGGGRKGVTLNVLPGQLVIFDPRTNVSLPATATAAEADRIVLGVGVDLNGDGVSDVLRRPFGEQIYGEYINAATAEPPRCGVAPVADILFGCVECDNTYTVRIDVEDNSTQNQYPYNRPSSYVFSAMAECLDCDPCDATVSATEIACKLVDRINRGVMGTDPKKISTFKKDVAPELPFYAVRLFDATNSSQQFCFSPDASGCGDGCLEIDQIVSMTFDDKQGGGAQTTTFTNNEGNTDKTLLGQLEGIVQQINIALDGNGSAVLVGGQTTCCQYLIEVNTCGTFTLTDANGAVTPCAQGNPFDPITVEDNCKNCGSAPSPLKFDAGIRIISKASMLDCNCQYPPNPMVGFFGTKLEAFASSGWSPGSTYVREVTPLKLPQNYGYQWQWREYVADNGGRGRGHNPYNDHYGHLDLPGQQDRANSVLTKCHESYCSYIIDHGLPHTNNGVSSPFRMARGRTVVLVPSKDSTTQTELESALNAYIKGGTMPKAMATITCSEDQDQNENDSTTGFPAGLAYPNANGYLV